MGWSDPKRVRTSVRYRSKHIGYVTVVSYPNRDLTAFSEGSPYSEIVVANLHEEHVALLQCYKEHWVIYCGNHYTTTERTGVLHGKEIMRLAVFTLLNEDATDSARARALKEVMDRVVK